MALKLKSALTINDYSPIISDFSNVHGFVNTDEVKEAYAGEKYILGEDKTAYAQYDLQGIADAVYNLGYRFAIGNNEPEYRKNQLYYLDKNDNTLKPHESNEPLNTLWLVDPDAYGENIVRLDEKESIKSLTNINGFWYLFSKDSETSDLGEGILLIKESTFYYRPKGSGSKIFLTSAAIMGNIDSDKEVAIHLSLSGKRNDYTATGYKIEKSGLADDKSPLNLVGPNHEGEKYNLRVYNENGEELECLNPDDIKYIQLPSDDEIENNTIAKLTVYFDDGGISQNFYLYFRNGAVSQVECSKNQNGDWILSDGSRKVKVKDKEGSPQDKNLNSVISESGLIDIRYIEALEEEPYRIEINGDSAIEINAINIESVYIDVTDNILDGEKNKVIIASSERVYLKRNFKVDNRGIATRSNFGITIDSVRNIDTDINNNWPSGTISFSYGDNTYYIKPSFS